MKKAKRTTESRIVGREREIKSLQCALALNRNVLIEGPVGVGKTFLVQQVLSRQKRGFERVDGDTRYTEQKLTGWFDPPLVLKKGYLPQCFVDGPLVSAMKGGKVLFINELNRMPEAVQNILLPAMDERRITLPKLGEIVAREGFAIVATQNPREFTATHALSEALLDRFEMITLNYQSREEELEILSLASGGKAKEGLLEKVLDLVRATRSHPSIKRGASIRAGLAIFALLEAGVSYEEAVMMALPSRMELVSNDEDIYAVIQGLLEKQTPARDEKKKSPLEYR